LSAAFALTRLVLKSSYKADGFAAA
jgi:hypothetical protein